MLHNILLALFICHLIFCWHYSLFCCFILLASYLCVYVRACVCVCIYVCARVCVHACVYMCVCACMHVCICVCVHYLVKWCQRYVESKAQGPNGYIANIQSEAVCYIIASQPSVKCLYMQAPVAI